MGEGLGVAPDRRLADDGKRSEELDVLLMCDSFYFIYKIGGGSGWGEGSMLAQIRGWRMTGSAVTAMDVVEWSGAKIGRGFGGGRARDSAGSEAGG